MSNHQFDLCLWAGKGTLGKAVCSSDTFGTAILYQDRNRAERESKKCQPHASLGLSFFEITVLQHDQLRKQEIFQLLVWQGLQTLQIFRIRHLPQHLQSGLQTAKSQIADGRLPTSEQEKDKEKEGEREREREADKYREGVSFLVSML